MRVELYTRIKLCIVGMLHTAVQNNPSFCPCPYRITSHTDIHDYKSKMGAAPNEREAVGAHRIMSNTYLGQVS